MSQATATTAIVLAQAILCASIRAVVAGLNAVDPKRGVAKAVLAPVAERGARRRKITTPAKIAQVVTISANGQVEIGRLIAEAMEEVGNEGVITVEETKGVQTELSIVEGMEFDRGLLSPCFTMSTARMNVVLDDPYTLLCDKKLSALQLVLPLLESVAQSSRPRTLDTSTTGICIALL